MPAGVAFTIYEKPAKDGPLSKIISLGSNRRPVSDSASCFMAHGSAMTITVRGLAEFAAFLQSLPRQSAIGLGVIDEIHRVQRQDGSPDWTNVVRDRDLANA